MNGLSTFTFTVYVQAQTPSTAAAFLRFTSITAGDSHTCGLTPGGGAYCWGWNGWGQLGTGDTTYRSVPTPVAGGHTFTALAAGASFVCGLEGDGQAWCWGGNGGGQLGVGDTVDKYVPNMVAQPAGITFASIVAGGSHACGLTAAGQAYCWGRVYPDSAQPTAPRPQPAPVAFASLAAAEEATCGLTSDGQAWCWGLNQQGELGDSTTINRDTAAPAVQPAGLRFASLTGSILHFCGVTPGHEAYCWGDNTRGELGGGAGSYSAVPTAVVAVPGAAFERLAAGFFHTCGVTTSGEVYCWGSNQYGQRGGPGRVVAQPDLPFTALAAGDGHTCALSTGAVYCWGTNAFGDLGDGTVSPRTTPVAVAGTH